MLGLLVEWPIIISFTSTHSTDNLNMSNPALQTELDDCQFEHILSQLEQYFPLRDQVTRALNHANAAFASQCTEPDGYKFMQTCDDLTTFLKLKVALEYSEQKLVVQVLQVACAMHENAVNDPMLTLTQRSAHYLATASLVPLCKSALEVSVTYHDLWCQVLCLTHRAEQALSKATDALDLSKYLDFENMKDDDFHESGNGAGQPSATPSKPASPRGSVHDTTADARLTPRSTKLKDKALAMLKDQPHKSSPLGRRHTMPALLHTTSNSSSPSSRTAAGRTSSKAHSRGQALHAVEETEE
ncbi:hypothetical protein OG21DRAFT_1506114 [Imleria badia]|nr:hypothetical protein OG21DRAFT_1506114 [Imleria badia]